MTQFNIGDRICSKKESGYWLGFEGTVVSLDPIKVVITKQDPRNTLYPVGEIFSLSIPSYYQLISERDTPKEPESKWPLKKGDTVYTTNTDLYDTVGHELTIYSVDEEDDVLPYEVKDESGQFEWVNPDDLTAEKPVVLTPAVGDKVRFTNGGKHHRWIEDAKPEGTVVERSEGNMRVEWTDKDKDTTFSGFGRSTSEESIAEQWEKIEEFTPQRKFQIGDKVRLEVDGWITDYNGSEGTVTGYRDSGLVQFEVHTVVGRYVSVGEIANEREESLVKIEEFTSEEPVYKFEVGQTVKVIDNTSYGYENGTVAAVEVREAGDVENYYTLKAEGQCRMAHTESDLEAHTPHALDDAKVGTAFAMYHPGGTKARFLVVKVDDDKWKQFALFDGVPAFGQTLSDSGALSHFDWPECYETRLVS